MYIPLKAFSLDVEKNESLIRKSPRRKITNKTEL
jgi:hypothetical protein